MNCAKSFRDWSITSEKGAWDTGFQSLACTVDSAENQVTEGQSWAAELLISLSRWVSNGLCPPAN